MSQLLREAKKTLEGLKELKEKQKGTVITIVVSSLEDERKQVQELDSKSEYTNVVIIRRYLWNQILKNII